VSRISLLRRLATKLGWAAFVLWAVVSLTFVINNVLPTDAARMVAGPQARPAEVARIREQLGLTRPVLVQYLAFLQRLVHLSSSSASEREHTTCATLGPLHVDLGKSYQQRRPVTDILAERLPRTAMLALAALVVQTFLGITAGVLAASAHGRPLDRLLVGASLVGVSTPTFIVGLTLQYLLARRLHLLPVDGFGHSLPDHLASLCLPALTLGLFGAAYYLRVAREDMIDVLRRDFVRTARAKGASEVVVMLRHALRNALLPLVTMLGMDLGSLIGGAAVVETLFRWPGLGALSVTALLDRDGPVIVGAVLVTSTAVVLSNVAVDLLYGVLDPETRG
jgi:peptide/nickel transport system permease protein